LKNIKFKTLLLVISLLFLYTLICASTYASTISSDISTSLFRLHVIANSDSDEDQNLKYLVRDNVISYMNELLPSSSTREEAISVVNEHLDDFKTVAQKTVYENGFNYDVTLEVRKFLISYKNIWRYFITSRLL